MTFAVKRLFKASILKVSEKKLEKPGRPIGRVPSCAKVRANVSFQASSNFTVTPQKKPLSLIPFVAQTGKVLMPGAVLPLDIQTPLDIYMIQQALAHNRLVGIIQPQRVSGKNISLYQVGCLGRITTFSEQKDGNKKGGFYVAIKGIKKFYAVGIDKKELLKGQSKFLQIHYDMGIQKEGGSTKENKMLAKEARKQLMRVLPGYLASTPSLFLGAFSKSFSLERFQKAGDAELIASLTMLCPFEANEKQAILEKNTAAERFEVLTTFLKMRETPFASLLSRCH